MIPVRMQPGWLLHHQPGGAGCGKFAQLVIKYRRIS